MTDLYNRKTVQFPALSDEEAAKIVKLTETMGEFMGTDLHLTEVRILAVEYDADRTDVGQVLTSLAQAKRPKKKAA